MGNPATWFEIKSGAAFGGRKYKDKGVISFGTVER